jgi:hypothetical protein
MVLTIKGRSLLYDPMKEEIQIEIDCRPLDQTEQELLELLFPDVLNAAHNLLTKQALLDAIK